MAISYSQSHTVVCRLDNVALILPIVLFMLLINSPNTNTTAANPATARSGAFQPYLPYRLGWACF